MWTPEDLATQSEQEEEHEPDEDEINMWTETQIDMEHLTWKSIKEMAHLGNQWTNRGQMDFVTWLLQYQVEYQMPLAAVSQQRCARKHLPLPVFGPCAGNATGSPWLPDGNRVKRIQAYLNSTKQELAPSWTQTDSNILGGLVREGALKLRARGFAVGAVTALNTAYMSARELIFQIKATQEWNLTGTPRVFQEMSSNMQTRSQ